MSKPLDQMILETALDLIQDPKHWTTGYFARDKEGRECFSWDKDAYSFCSIGAVSRAFRDITGRPDAPDANPISVLNCVEIKPGFDPYVEKARKRLERAFQTGLIAMANDTLGHTFVVEKFKEAIKS